MTPINVIMLAPHSNTFIGDSVKACSKSVESITVYMHHNNFSELSEVFPFGGFFAHIRKFTKRALVQENDFPSNVRLRVFSFPYFLPDASNPTLPNRIFKHINKAMRDDCLNANIIHAHFTWPQGFASARLKEKLRVPLIITAHGHDVYALPFRNEAWKARIKYGLEKADYIITVSTNNLIYLEKLGINTPVEVIPNGFRSELFHPIDKISIRNKLKLPLDKHIITSVGNLEAIKGHKFLIEATSRLVKGDDKVLTVIIGSGSQLGHLEKLIKDLKLENNVLLVGSKPHNEIPLWMNACDIYALPSLREGNPTVMFECLGCGKPFVGTRVGGVPEIITSSDYGLLCEPGDPKELADKIAIAFERKWNSEKIVNYSHHFNWETISEHIVDTYKNVLEK